MVTVMGVIPRKGHTQSESQKIGKGGGHGRKTAEKKLNEENFYWLGCTRIKPCMRGQTR